jgi:tRNA-2-methylthio-N6-dimethylallyladenosine synthase
MSGFWITTFGCQMNEHDSTRMGELLMSAGHRAAPSLDSADIIILNTCSVREKAMQKLRSEVGRMALRKQERSDLVIVVAGCIGRQQGEKLLKTVPEVDLIIGPDNIGSLPALLVDLELGGPRRAVVEFDLDAPRFLLATPESGRTPPVAYVTVMKGCDERCAFCIVPYTRGAERYRPSGEVIEEIRRLVSVGVKEVTLLGQTVNSYRDPSGRLGSTPDVAPVAWSHTQRAIAVADESEFPALLLAIAERVPELKRLRYASPHPRHLTHALIEAHRRIGILAKHLHLPVQSGNDQVLKRMIRRYTREEYVERAEALKRAVPDLTLSTDIIVGFPGETRAQFQDTLTLVEQMGYVGLFGFKYSPRPSTPALRLSDDVSEQEKSDRLEALFACHETKRRSHLEGLVGTVQEVLVEGRKSDGAFTGRTVRNEIVHLAAKCELTGCLVPVRIIRGFKNSLAAETIDDKIRIPVSELPRLVSGHEDEGPLASNPRAAHLDEPASGSSSEPPLGGQTFARLHDKRQLPVV